MERITFEGNFCDIARCREEPCKYPDGGCSQRQVWERLKAFEDAEERGRLQPVVYSYWYSGKSGKSQLPVCHACERYVDILQGELNYCPNCGAKMDGEERKP